MCFQDLLGSVCMRWTMGTPGGGWQPYLDNKPTFVQQPTWPFVVFRRLSSTVCLPITPFGFAHCRSIVIVVRLCTARLLWCCAPESSTLVLCSDIDINLKGELSRSGVGIGDSREISDAWCLCSTCRSALRMYASRQARVQSAMRRDSLK